MNGIRIQNRWLSLAAVLAVLPLAACDDEGPPEGRVATVAAVDGDGQQAVVATQLPRPLVARALDGTGKPVVGAAVQWQVSTGGGIIAAPTSRTDNEGRATTTWTLGPTAGAQAVTVRVGTATFVFNASARAGNAAAVQVSPGAIMLDAIGATTNLGAIAKDAHGNTIEGRAPTWISPNATVATVDANGTVRAVGPGTTRIRATLDGATGEAEVVVAPAVTSVLVEPALPTLGAIGATLQLQATARDRNNNPVPVTPGTLVWSSSNPAVIAVNGGGLVTAQAVGTAQIRATLGAVTGQTQVTVNPIAVSLSISPKLDTLNSGTLTRQMTALARDANNHVIPSPQVTWSSSNPTVASVTATGMVTAFGNGTAIIRATSGAVKDSATIVVRLNSAPKAVADLRTALKDTPSNVAAPGLIANDTLGIPGATIASFGGGSLGGTITSNAAGTTRTFAGGGSLRVNADGSYSFTPAAGFQGAFTFQYRLQNVAGVSDATVTIEVGSAPVAVDDALTTTRNVTLNVTAPGLLQNDNLGFPLATIATYGGGALGGNAGSFTAGNGVAFGVGGFLRVNPNGSLTFTPANGFTGTFTFQYRLSNGVGSSDGTVVVTVNN